MKPNLETLLKQMHSSDDTPDDAELSKPIRESDDIFALVVETMTTCGYAGDPAHVELLYAIFTSRLLPRPMCAFLKAPSSSGKSWLLNRTLELFPPEAYEIKSGFTPKAIAYGRSDLRHRILAIQEASGMQGREGNLLVRTLISEGLIRWEVTGREQDGFATREVVRPGPIAFVMTTTHNVLHGEDETRALSIQVDDTATHTRRVLDSIAGRYSGAAEPTAIDLAPWHAYQRWLAAGPREAVIPFAGAIAQHYWAQANRSKRDFEQVLTAIGTSALMHQTKRETDGHGRVIATFDDYAMARGFLLKVLGEASGAAVPASVRETYYAILDLIVEQSPGPNDLRCPNLTEVAARLGIDKAAASRRVAKAKELGFVADQRIGPGLPSRITLLGSLPQDTDVLPSVETLQKMQAGAPAGGDGPQENRAAPPATEETSAKAAPAPDLADAPAPPATQTAPGHLVAAIIANAPRPDLPDGGYLGRRAIAAYRTAMASRRDSTR